MEIIDSLFVKELVLAGTLLSLLILRRQEHIDDKKTHREDMEKLAKECMEERRELSARLGALAEVLNQIKERIRQ